MESKIIKNLSLGILKKIQNLYLTSFDDSKTFVDLFFSSYAKNQKIWYELNSKQEVKIITTLIKKRLFIANKKCDAFLISSVAVSPKYQNHGLMTSFFANWLNQLKNETDYVFIQAYNWEIYQKFDFVPVTYKSEWILRKDQFFKKTTLLNQIDFKLMNKVYIAFLKQNKISNFSYKTSKEFKLYNKMLLSTNDKIFQLKRAWIVVSNHKVIDFAFVDLKEFIKLISLLPFQTRIASILPLDKRFFTQMVTNEIWTKALNNEKTKNLNIYFNDCF